MVALDVVLCKSALFAQDRRISVVNMEERREGMEREGVLHFYGCTPK